MGFPVLKKRFERGIRSWLGVIGRVVGLGPILGLLLLLGDLGGLGGRGFCLLVGLGGM
jgi:hypothetical protein